MKKKIIVISALSLSTVLALGGLVAITTTKLGADLKAEPGELNDYMLQFNGENNVFEGDGTYQAALSDPTNKVSVTVSGYSQEANAWGKLANGGYLLLNDRVGGLMSVNYVVSGDLVLEYGYYEFDKPTYYRADLPSSLQNFNFPENRGYPDVFKLSNEGENPVTIWGFNVYYNCSQQDLHVHDSSTSEVERKMVDNVPVYYKACDICEEEEVIDLSAYSIKVDNVEYTPYTYMNYNGIGELDFDYVNYEKKNFVLTIDGDHHSTDLRVDTNTSSQSGIIIKSKNNASMHEFKFRGGYGTLIFEGEELSFPNGTLDSEAIYTTIRSPLTFTRNDHTGTAIYVNNGQLTLEGGSNINVTGYEYGVKFNQSATGTGGLSQSGGTLTIEDCIYGIAKGGNYVPELRLRSEVYLTNNKVGIYDCTTSIGRDENAGKVIIQVDPTKATNTGNYWNDRAVGILNTSSSRKLNLNKGKLFIYCNPSARNDNTTSAIGNTSGWKNGILTVSADFKYGFAQIRHGFDGNSTPVGDNDYSNTNTNTFYYYDVNDLASYCYLKPQGTEVASFNDFTNLF